MVFFHVPSGCLIPYFRTCVVLHMRRHPQQIIMMLLSYLDDTITWRYGFFSDLLVWRIGKREYFGRWSTIVQYVHICAMERIGASDGIAYCTITCHGSMLLYMDMLIHCSTTWTFHSFYFQFQSHMRRSRIMFS